MINTICLNENVSSITALSNDNGYENYLVNQIENFEVDENDSVIVISSSVIVITLLIFLNIVKKPS